MLRQKYNYGPAQRTLATAHISMSGPVPDGVGPCEYGVLAPYGSVVIKKSPNFTQEFVRVHRLCSHFYFFIKHFSGH